MKNGDVLELKMVRKEKNESYFYFVKNKWTEN